jgi:outer membrane protein assembly factor BamB
LEECPMAALRKGAWLLIFLLIASLSLGFLSPAPRLETEPDPPSCDLGRLEQGQIGVWRFRVINGGGGELEWSTSSNKDWILLYPQSGSLKAQEATWVRVTLDTAQLIPGRHRGQITIDSNGGGKTGTVTMEVVAQGGLADSPWPTFQRDSQRTGRSPFRGPESPQTRWSFETSGPIWSSPVIGAEGTIYATSLDGWLYALSSAGQKKWSLHLGGLLESSPALGKQGMIYVGNSHKLYAITSEGKIRWAVELEGLVTSSPIIGSDGTVYLGGKAIFAINPDGSRKWTFETSGHIDHSAPALGEDGAIYAGFSNAASGSASELIALNPNGTERWEFHVPGTIPCSPAVGEDEAIYFLSKAGLDGDLEHNRLYAVNRNGKARWSRYVTVFPHTAFLSSPAIGIEGTIYVGSDDYALYAIAPDGKERWHLTTEAPIHSSPAIDGEGTIYVGSDDGNLYAIYADGSLKWHFPTGGPVLSSPAIGADGTIYVGSNDHHLYAVGNPQGRAVFQFGSLSVAPTAVVPGEQVRAQAEVANRGDASGTVTAELLVDGEVRDTSEVTLGSGQATLVSFSFSFSAEELGEHQVTIDGLAPVAVKVFE